MAVRPGEAVARPRGRRGLWGARALPRCSVIGVPRGQACGTISALSHMVEEITIGDRGRVVLPAAVRNELGLTPGTRLLLSTEDDGSVRLRPYRVVADSLLGIFADASPETSLVDKLIAERRREAARETALEARDLGSES